MFFGVQYIPGGESGTDATVSKMSEFVLGSLTRPKIRMFTLSILDRANADSKDDVKAARAVYDWIHENIRYVKDPVGVETVQNPEATLKIKAGDCDDHSVLISSMLESIGIETRFVVIGESPDRFQHIFVQAHIKNKWIPVDTTLNHPFGYQVNMRSKKFYNREGNPMRLLGEAGRGVMPMIPRREVLMIAYRNAYGRINLLYNSGRINRSDLDEYVRIIDRGNTPNPRSVIVKPIRAAIKNFIRDKATTNYTTPDLKQLSGIDNNLSTFFGDLWDSTKNAVRGFVEVRKPDPGGEPAGTIVIDPPDIKIPEGIVRAEVSPQAASQAAIASVGAILSHPLFIGLTVAGMGYFLTTRMKG